MAPVAGFAGIGNTPMGRVARLVKPGSAALWVKLEGGNPTGSYKDRMALAVIEAAEGRGELRPGQPVVEATGGSAGISLAYVCAVKGHPLRIVTSTAIAPSKVASMRALGADVELLEGGVGVGPSVMTALMARVAEFAQSTGAFATRQFHNPDAAHGYDGLGREIAAELPRVDAFALFVGTAACFLGTTRALRQSFQVMRRIVVEPSEAAMISGGQPGRHMIEGGAVGFVPPMLTPADFDEITTVSSSEALAMARRAASEEGIFAGPSTGANLVAAIRMAELLDPSQVVVTVAVDSGLKYVEAPPYRTT